jgi:hypothetical protein
MSNPIPSPEFEEKIRQAVSTPRPRQAFVWQQRAKLISQADRIKATPSHGLKMLMRFSLAIMVIFLTVVVLTTTDVAQAMKKMLGYIPGLGLVEKTSLRLLAEPVSTERQGITLTVEKASADLESTILLIQVEGFTPPAADSSEEMAACQSSPRLHLLDDTKLEVIGGDGYGWGTGYTQRLTFPALPPDLNDFILEIPCLMQVAPGQWPQDWIIPLHLVNAEPGQVAPVIEIPPTPTPNAVTSAPPEGEAEGGENGAAKPFYNVIFSLDDVVNLGDGYIFMCSFQWEDEIIIDFGLTPLEVQITDSQGNEVPFEEVAPNSIAEAGIKRAYSAYQVSGILLAWPLTISVTSLQLDIRTDAPFSFNPTGYLWPGMAWQPGIEMPVDVYTLQIPSAEMVSVQDENGATQSGFKFTMQSPDGIVGARVVDPINPFSSGGGGETDTGEFTATILYPTLPATPFNLIVSDVSILESGNWQVSWSP